MIDPVITLALIVYFTTAIWSYKIFRHVLKNHPDNPSWNRQDRVLSIVLATGGPLSFISMIIVFIAVKIYEWHQATDWTEWRDFWNEEVDW